MGRSATLLLVSLCLCSFTLAALRDSKKDEDKDTIGLSSTKYRLTTKFVQDPAAKGAMYEVADLALFNQNAAPHIVDLVFDSLYVPTKDFTKNELCKSDDFCIANGKATTASYNGNEAPAQPSLAYVQLTTKSDKKALEADDIKERTPDLPVSMITKGPKWALDYGVLGLKGKSSQFSKYLNSTFSMEGSSKLLSYRLELNKETGALETGTIRINGKDSPIKCTRDLISDKEYGVKADLWYGDDEDGSKTTKLIVTNEHDVAFRFKGGADFVKKAFKRVCNKETGCKGDEVKLGRLEDLKFKMDCSPDQDVIKHYTFTIEGKDYASKDKEGNLVIHVGEAPSGTAEHTFLLGRRFFVKKELIFDVDHGTMGFGDPDYEVNKLLWALIAAGVAVGLIVISVVSAIIGHLMYGKGEDGEANADDFQRAED